ncbi:MAG: ATP-dependent DNA ligase [Chloroflexota bacterium]|nr:ATP-dependent DNA ligase [Chloroflexota bacterium]MDQ5864303.1 ATP-dependent DNA ligase [Chloroflexota bacterium]
MTMPFGTLAATLEALEPVSGRTQMIAMLAEMLGQAGPQDIAQLVYLSQGRLLPDFIQKEFGMNERLVFRSVAQAYGAQPESVAARFKQLGDVGLVAQEFAQAGARQLPLAGENTADGVPLQEVYSHLTRITETVGSGSQEAKVTLLAELLARLEPLEAKHVGRIVVGRLRVGVGDPTLMDALSVAKAGDKSLRPGIERAYNLSTDLGLVARTLYSAGAEGLEEIRVKVGNPVRMALAERADSAEEILARLGKCAVEPKYDGFRMQVHKVGDQVAIFSRGLEDLSGMFPDVVAAVHAQIAARDAILEGEALAYEPETGRYQPFQVTSQRRRVHNIEEMSASLPLRLLAFDLLLLDGRDLTRAPYTERREALSEAIQPTDGLGGLQVSTVLITDDPEQIVLFYEDSLEEGLEGIVAKRLDGTYEAGKRGFNWIKMKRSYQTQMRDTVDCAIVGYYYGKGRRASWGIGSLLVSVYDKDTDTLPTVTRVASGLSDEGWRDLCRRLDADRIEHHDPRVISVITPDIWVVPRLVVELQADEVSRSQMHPAGRSDSGPGYALRFPRIIKERPERTPEDATSVEEVIKLYNMQGKGDTRGKRKAAVEEAAAIEAEV